MATGQENKMYTLWHYVSSPRGTFRNFVQNLSIDYKIKKINKKNMKVIRYLAFLFVFGFWFVGAIAGIVGHLNFMYSNTYPRIITYSMQDDVNLFLICIGMIIIGVVGLYSIFRDVPEDFNSRR